MYFNNYSVRVIGGKECPGGYVELVNKQQYRLQLRNDRDERCDAQIEIDGKTVGIFRIGARQSITIERPQHDDGHFTFYELGTVEAEQANLLATDSLGLVLVTFTPEKKVRPLTYVSPNTVWPGFPWDTNTWTFDTVPITTTYSSPPSMYSTHAAANCATSARTPGGTGLSGKSEQTFYDAPLLDHDYTQVSSIYLRLVAKRDDDAPRPLTQMSTPIPPAIG